MNSFKRTGNSKESLGVGLMHFVDRVNFIEFTHLNKSNGKTTNVVGRRTITNDDLDSHHPIVTYSKNSNFFRRIFELARSETHYDMLAIQLRDGPLDNLCFDKDEIQIIKHLMGFDPIEFHTLNPKLSLAYKNPVHYKFSKALVI